MDEIKGRVLLKILQKHGLCNKANTSRYIGLIRDNFAGCKLERNLLILSLRANIPQELISDIKSNSTSDSFPESSNYNPTLLKTKFIEKLQTKFWLTKEASEWIVETWIKAILESLHYKKKAPTIIEVPGSTIKIKSNIRKAALKKLSATKPYSTKKAILDKPVLVKAPTIVSNNKPDTPPNNPPPSSPTETKPKTVRIPAGTFSMGSPKSEFGRAEDETIHNVTISKDFLLCVHPVTQELWRSVMGYDSNKIEDEEENFPIINISWNDCHDFIEKFNILTDEIYRLPTEAEWEYACRAGTDTAYSFGKFINEDNANYKNSPFPMLKPVCSCLPNAFGLYDMHGNVWEWCEDWYGVYISTFQWLTNFSRTPLKDPYGPIKGEKRVIRGGSFNSLPKDLRSSCRSKLLPSESYNSVGFRLVKQI